MPVGAVPPGRNDARNQLRRMKIENSGRDGRTLPVF